MKLKEFIKQNFPGLIKIRNKVYNDFVHRRFKNKPISEVFEMIYHENHWNDAESKSGTGSSAEQAAEVRRIVEEAINIFKVKSILDIPCGDFNWMRDVKFGECKYFGADIVKELIAFNKQNYENEDRQFFVADLTSSTLPQVELIFCRDCLVHLSYSDIRKAISNIKRSGIRYILTTTFPEHKNHDIVTGNWRPLNLQASPFIFPTPIRIFNEHCTEADSYKDKSLALWEIKDLPSF